MLIPTLIAVLAAPQLAQAPSVEATLEAEIGAEAAGPGGTLGYVVDLAADADGDVYVLDNRAGIVRVFSAAGDFLRAFGQSDDGSDRLSRPTGIDVRESVATVLNAGGRTSVFMLDGRGVTSGSLPFGSLAVAATGGGSFAVHSSAAISRSAPLPSEHIIVIDATSADTLLTVGSADVLYRSPMGSSLIRTTECRLAYVAVGPGGEIWLASGLDGTLAEWRRNGGAYRSVRTERIAGPGEPLPDSARTRLMALLPRQLDPEQGTVDLPPLRSPVCGLEPSGSELWVALRGEDGRNRWVSIDPETLAGRRQVLAPEGVALTAFSGDRAYGIRRDDTGQVTVLVFRLE